MTKSFHPVTLAATACLLSLPLAAGAGEITVQQAASQIDALIEKGYAANDVKPNPLTTDATFARRAYLDIAGRIPTAAEARAFLDSMETTKRAGLIDQLLDSDGYVSHQFNYWADVLRITSRMNGQGPQNGAAYANWVKDAIRQNLPYNKFVHSLITAEGMIDENGAVGFYLRDRGMALDHLATTVQVFLGTQMVCAQCHDHPFDEWTQMDYYQLAAFSTPMDVKRNPNSIGRAIEMVNQQSREEQQRISRDFKQQRDKTKDNRKRNQERQKESQARKAVSNQARITTRGLGKLGDNFRNAAVGDTGKPLKLPHDYQYNDAEPNDVVTALTPFGKKISVSPGENRIGAYADWMTSSDNPRFTKTIANRIWKRTMGVGLFEPVDNLREDTEASNPELLAFLEKLIVDLDYDLKAYYRVLYNTKTYQREASSADMLAKYYYPGPRLRRMTAEQVWDSLVTLVRADADHAKDPRAANYASSDGRLKAWKRIEQQSPEVLLERQEELAKFNKNSEQRIEKFRKQADEAIAANNANRAVGLAQQLIKFNREGTQEYARLTFWDLEMAKNSYFRTPFRRTPTVLFRQLKEAFPKAEFPDEREFSIGAMTAMASGGKPNDREKENSKAEQRQLRKEMGKQAYAEYQRERSAQGRMRSYVRASEISSPAPDGHFLRTFGQSDRLLIENANDQASVPQTLALMNGRLFSALTDHYSVLSKEIRAADDNDAAIDAIYLSMLSRKPTASERSLLQGEFEVAKRPSDATRGIIWTLLNTQQFLFIQ